MPDPVTLYVQCLPTRPEAFGTWFCEASPAEVLAHPAAAEVVRECDHWHRRTEEEADKCARLQAVLDAARNLILAADCPAYVWPMGPCGPTSWRGWDDDFAIPALMRKLDEAVKAADRAAEGREG